LFTTNTRARAKKGGKSEHWSTVVLLHSVPRRAPRSASEENEDREEGGEKKKKPYLSFILQISGRLGICFELTETGGWEGGGEKEKKKKEGAQPHNWRSRKYIFTRSIHPLNGEEKREGGMGVGKGEGKGGKKKRDTVWFFVPFPPAGLCVPLDDGRSRREGEMGWDRKER